QRSYYDFYDNVTSVLYTLNGQCSSQVNSNSIMAYLQKYNKSMADDLQSKVSAALSALETAKAGTPFVLDSHSANAKAAMDAINTLDDAINEASSWITAN
ncbi:MAG: imelysin, partial [Prevotella sp.]|nr:imelysin [Prevotella sp.]